MHVGEIKVYVDMSEFVFAKKNYSCANTFGRNLEICVNMSDKM